MTDETPATAYPPAPNPSKITGPIVAVVLLMAASAPALGASLGPGSKDGAMIAGAYVAVAEACFGDQNAYLTSEAKLFAKASRKQNSKWFFAAYNEEARGSSAYDEVFCNDVIFKLYESNGSDSSKLGFRIMNTDKFAD